MINRDFFVAVPHPKGGNIFWTCVKDNNIKYKDKYKGIGLSVLSYSVYE